MDLIVNGAEDEATDDMNGTTRDGGTVLSDVVTRARKTGPSRLPRSNEPIIKALEANGGLVAPTARTLGVSRQALTVRLAQDPELRAARDEIQESLLDLAEGHLLLQVKAGDPKAVRFFLRTIGRHRGYSERVEVSGPGGGEIRIVLSPREMKL